MHVIDRCIAGYSTHKRVCKTIAILLALRQFWIAMLRMKQWQTKKDWGNMIRSIRTLHTASPDDPQSTTVTNDDLRTMLAGVQIIPLPKI